MQYVRDLKGNLIPVNNDNSKIIWLCNLFYISLWFVLVNVIA